MLVFPHIFWDGTFFWGHDLFPNYEAFFAETLKIAYATPRANWIVKIHPANLVKNRRDGFAGRSNEMQVIEAMGSLPPHIKVLDATTDISTLSLYEIGDVCVTVRGTVGMEAACFGLTTVTAGTGRYDRLGFTIDPETPEEFRDAAAARRKLEEAHRRCSRSRAALSRGRSCSNVPSPTGRSSSVTPTTPWRHSPSRFATAPVR